MSKFKFSFFLAFLLLLSIHAGSPSYAAANLEARAPILACQDLLRSNVGSSGAPTMIATASELVVDGHQMCVVKGTISPRINFEVRLPVAGWTQRYLQTGCGGLCGRLEIETPQRDCTPETRGEFAMASTDMGHDGPGGIWGASDMQLRVDFAYRAVHVTSLVAKQLIEAYYGQGPKFSYFSGCSDGGREALMEAQRFPDDFNGIAAGAPALNFMVQNSFYHAWNAAIVNTMSGKPTLTAKDLPVLHAAALKACDAQDGTEDSIISDPTACIVNTEALICKPGEKENCLTDIAAKTAKELYRGAHDGDTKLVIGSLMPGSELAWEGVLVPGDAGAVMAPNPPEGKAGGPPPIDKTAIDQPRGPPPGMVMSPMIANEMIPSLAYVTPYNRNWTLKDFAFTAASFEAMRPMHTLFDATNPDLGPFHAAGGKLLLWHGLADPHISPLNSVAYYQSIVDIIGAEKVNDMLRLYLVPGLYHCGGGNGMTSIDVMTPLMDWVESKVAPDKIVASANDTNALAGKGRTLFPFPKIAELKQGGKSESPSDWIKGKEMQVKPALYKDWAGSDFFTPDFQKSCSFEGLSFVCK